MTCGCRKGATCAEHLAEADLTLRPVTVVERDEESDLARALREEWCNGCGCPRSRWTPVCPGMTVGDWTHYHSPDYWRIRLA